MPTKDDTIADYRQRYDALKASGQAPKRLPPPSARPAPPIAEEALIRRETLPAGWYWTATIAAGETLRIALSDAPAAVSLLAWNKADPAERLNYADTVKVQWTAALRKGRVILSDMGKVMFSIVEDSCCAHDALIGGSTPESTTRKYGEGHRNTRDNFVLAASKFGLDARDVPPCVTFFAPVSIDDQGRFRWNAEDRRTGDYVDLRAEMDLYVALSNCPHPFDPASTYAPAAVEVSRFDGPAITADDLCRTATDEARRAFENNDLAAA